MDKGIYVAMTGASAALQAQSALAQNLANADTAGFKAVLIQTQPYQVNGPGLPSRFDTTLKDGGFDASGGSTINTGNPLDVSLKQNAWLAVQDTSGNEAYTRAGNLHVNENGQLTTASGRAVLSDGGPITVPPNQKVNIASDGTISIVPQGQNPDVQANVGRLKIVEHDPLQLRRGADGLMRRIDNAPGTPVAGEALIPGAIEGSNVNPSDALVSMISLSRQFDLQVQVLHNSDENARSATSLLRLTS